MSGRLWERDLIVIYVSGRLWGLQILTELRVRVGPLKNDLTCERTRGSSGKLSHTYFMCLGGSGNVM